MEIIFSEILRALGYLFIAGVALFAYNIARSNTESGHLKMVLFKGFLYCAGIALFASMTLGDASCEFQSDPIYGGCDQYADDAYEPTAEQRIANFAYFMTLLYLPVIFGAFKGKDD